MTLIERAYDGSHGRPTTSYEAVSYAWGSDADSEYILDDANTYLPIRQNVAEMLRYLRVDSDYRSLWIDAICTNQADDWEKGKQVVIMGEIYAYADRVLIWSGKTEDRYPELLEGIVGDREFHFLHLEELLQSRWFSRRWVVQEVMHAREAFIVCGGVTTGFRQLAVLLLLGCQASLTVGLSPRFVEALAKLFHLAGMIGSKDDIFAWYSVNSTLERKEMDKSESMTELLIQHSAAECADGRDKIYVLRSLSATSIPVDYHISVEELYRRLSHIEVTISPMALMSCAGAFGACAASWIPDWRLLMRHAPFGASITHRVTDPKTHSLVRLTGDLLTLQANLVGTVGAVDSVGSETAPYGESLYSCVQFFASHYSISIPDLSLERCRNLLCTTAAGYYASKDPFVFDLRYASVLARTIMGENLETADVLKGIEARAKTSQYRHIKKWDNETWEYLGGRASWVQIISLGVALLKEKLTRTMRGRSSFFTKTGQFGLVLVDRTLITCPYPELGLIRPSSLLCIFVLAHSIEQSITFSDLSPRSTLRSKLHSERRLACESTRLRNRDGAASGRHQLGF